jgi:cysteine desulfurase
VKSDKPCVIGSPPIYLDNHATTQVDPRVAEVMLRAMIQDFGNASSVEHVFGEIAAHAVDHAASEVAVLVGAEPEWVSFTWSASQAIRLAMDHAVARRRRPLRLALSHVEHRAVLEAAENLEHQGRATIAWIEVDDRARLREESLVRLLPDTDLICVMAANNEVGTIYPIERIARIGHAAGADILVDASQAAGRVAIDARASRADYLILNAHKMYGPKGVGALISPHLSAQALQRLPSAVEGTINVPAIAGFGEACRLRRTEMATDRVRISALRDRLQALLCSTLPDIVINGDQDNRLAENLHISAPGAANDLVIAALRQTVAISTGAACVAGADGPSHVLQAMGLGQNLQESALRIGVGRFNTAEQIELAAATIAGAIAAARQAQGVVA